MMHIYVCKNCEKAYIISRRKQAACRLCGKSMVCCPTEFVDWVAMTDEQRKQLIEAMCKKTY